MPTGNLAGTILKGSHPFDIRSISQTKALGLLLKYMSLQFFRLGTLVSQLGSTLRAAHGGYGAPYTLNQVPL